MIRSILFDKGDGNRQQEVVVECVGGSIDIMPKGYGDQGTLPGHGCPVTIEIFDGILQVVVRGDINDANPTAILNLEGARECLREEGDAD